MSRSEPPVKKVKVEHTDYEPDGPLGCQFCFETCRGKGMEVDAMICKGCCTMWHRACGEEWNGSCPKCGTNEKVEKFETPTVPKGQDVINVDDQESESSYTTEPSTRTMLGRRKGRLDRTRGESHCSDGRRRRRTRRSWRGGGGGGGGPCQKREVPYLT